MLINLKVKTLDAQTHEFSIDNEITVREFKDKIAEKTNIAAEQQRIIYCGRVLADEKQLKEYDVNGKVVHVAERPPPSARGPSNASSNSNDQPPRRAPRGLRNSPLFRALDGMVVGTMAIPMNAGVNNAQMAIHPFTSSSSFCMNRITVARHMLDCANNIAAFLEDPSRGLNNSSLDILAQGRWTMESTVVEVGITAADIPQNQNIVDMLQGAVSAALRRNGNTNVTVVQLPTVFGSNESTDGTQTATETTAVVVEDPMEDASDESGLLGGLNTSTEDEMDGTNDDDAQQTAESNASSGAAATAGTSSSSTSVGSSASGASASSSSSSTTGNTTEQNSSSRRRTGTNILADVIDQMRAVQTRLNPFIEQFYDMLRNEPTFEENDTTGRDNAQRLYDRVSEAFHYMSHAQHAISDLLLDVSQPAPRYLACRPILVEQSGYVSSNNYLTAAAAAAGLGNLAGGNATAARQHHHHHHQQQQQRTQQQQQSSEQQSQPQAQPQPQYQSSSIASSNTETTPIESVNIANAPVEDPVDDPIVTPLVVPNVANASNGNAANDNHQMQVARLIEAVVNSAPIDTEFHVQINTPRIVTFGVPLNAPDGTAATGSRTTNAAEQRQSEAGANANATEANANENSTPAAAAAATTATTGNGTESSGNNVNDSNSNNQTRSTTATLPTTATQTRSTSRPHVQMQMGAMPPSGGWNGRVIPANMMSSFDRFLPCNSHHIREPENLNANNTNNGNAGGPSVQLNPALNPTTASRANQRTLRTITDLFRHVRPPPIVGSTMTPQRPANVASNSTNTNAVPPAAQTPRATTVNPAVSTRVLAAQTSAPSNEPIIGDNETHRRIRLRVQLLNFITDNMFEGVPISDDTMTLAVNKALRWIYDKLIFLPQYDLPEYDSRDSVEMLLRRSLPLIINLVNDSQENPSQFEHRLKNLCEQLFKRLFSILHVCAGRMNAELYWGQLMRSLLVSLRSTFHGEALQFLQIYVTTEVPTATDTSDVQQFLVHKNNGESNLETDTDVEMTEVASTSQDTDSSPADETVKLPNVVPGSETWHSNFPNEWLPIITHDIQRQRENPTSQAPFSDAYISGMSAKRRKMIQSSKPPSDVKSLVADSVRRAIQATGVSTSTASNQLQSADEITATIAADTNVQASYCETLRTCVRERLKKDENYKADRFPQTSKFLNK